MPCLAATYALLPAEATSPCADAMLSTRPQLRARMPGSAMRMAWNAEVRLMAMIASQRSTGNSCTGATCWMPALLTRMSTRPNSRSHVRTMSSISSGLLMSAP